MANRSWSGGGALGRGLEFGHFARHAGGRQRHAGVPWSLDIFPGTPEACVRDTPEACVRVAGGYAGRRRHRVAEIVQSELALRQECVNNYK